VELGNDIVAIGGVTVAASTSCLAFSCALALETDSVTRRVLGSNIVSRSSPASLQVSDGLIALGESRLPASQETTIGVGVLQLVLGNGEHATAASDPWEAIIGLGLHGFEDAREIRCGNSVGDWSRPGRAQL